MILHKYLSPISHTKQRSPLTTHKPDRLFPTSNSDRPSPPTNPIAYFFNIKQRSPFTTPETRSPKSQHQTAIILTAKLKLVKTK
jgi:hypothetical protein